MNFVAIARSRRTGTLGGAAKRRPRVPVVRGASKLGDGPLLRQQVGQCEDNRIHRDQYSGCLYQPDSDVLLSK